MADYQITCIKTSGSNPTGEGITHLGSYSQRWTRSEVIQYIESRTHSFHTNVNGRRANVIVEGYGSGKYVKTDADGYGSNNLLSLPTCS